MSDGSRRRGVLVAVGGGEDKERDMVVLRKVLEVAGREVARVEIVPTASRDPREAARPYVRAFERLGVREPEILDVRTREEADQDEHVRRVLDADVVYFTGGDQLRLSMVLGGTRVYHALHERDARGGVIAGSSAGAAVMSATMISEGEARPGPMQKSAARLTAGFGFLPDVIVDTHFIDRGRLSRLLEAVAATPGHVGVGIGEDTAVVVREGRHLEVVGAGLVVVMDGHELGVTNVAEAEVGAPVVVERMVMHTLAAGYSFDLATRRFSRPRAPGHAAASP